MKLQHKNLILSDVVNFASARHILIFTMVLQVGHQPLNQWFPNWVNYPQG